MGCNTSQEQKTAVADDGIDVDAKNEKTETQANNKSARNSAKSDKSAKSAKNSKLTNGHADNADDTKSEGKFHLYSSFIINSLW